MIDAYWSEVSFVKKWRRETFYRCPIFLFTPAISEIACTFGKLCYIKVTEHTAFIPQTDACRGSEGNLLSREDFHLRRAGSLSRMRDDCIEINSYQLRARHNVSTRRISEGCQTLFTQLRRNARLSIHLRVRLPVIFEKPEQLKRTGNILQREIYIQPCALIHPYCHWHRVHVLPNRYSGWNCCDMRAALFSLKVTKHRQRAMPSQHKCRERISLSLSLSYRSSNTRSVLQYVRAFHFDFLHLPTRHGFDFFARRHSGAITSR